MKIVTVGVASSSPEDFRTGAGGAPHVGFTRGRLVSHRHDRSGQRIKTGNNETKRPASKPDVPATQFMSSLGV
jgi:hypothetical protein